MIVITGLGMDRTFKENSKKIWKDETVVGLKQEVERRGQIVNGAMEKFLAQKHVTISNLSYHV